LFKACGAKGNDKKCGKEGDKTDEETGDNEKKKKSEEESGEDSSKKGKKGEKGEKGEKKEKHEKNGDKAVLGDKNAEENEDSDECNADSINLVLWSPHFNCDGDAACKAAAIDHVHDLFNVNNSDFGSIIELKDEDKNFDYSF